MPNEAQLMTAAIAAMGHAYAPYSKFPVGAAILDAVSYTHLTLPTICSV